MAETIESVLRRAGERKAKELAKDARNKISQEYEYTVNKFYDDYSPKYYIRHKRPGMLKTFEKYYNSSQGNIYYGGIKISDNKMYTDYHDKPIDVLNSFLNGYHGRESLRIYSGINPMSHMLRYRDFLISEYIRKCSVK